MIKTYSELMEIEKFQDRISYLKTYNTIGDETFGSKREINQILYRSSEWRRFRREIMLRDCDGDEVLDLGHRDHPIYDKIIIHHINPITIDDILTRNYKVFDPENVISTSDNTHKIIHYEKELYTPNEYVERKKDDTTLWR